MPSLECTITVNRLGCVNGWWADVTEILESGRDGEILFSTRVYDCPEYAASEARRWIKDNERIVP